MPPETAKEESEADSQETVIAEPDSSVSPPVLDEADGRRVFD